MNNYFNVDTTFSDYPTINVGDNMITIQNTIDLGGIAKGYFLDYCKEVLA